MPDSPSLAPLAVIDTDATFCQPSEPPPIVGALGCVRSMRAVLAAPGLAGVHPVVLPTPSMARNCTSVWPSALTVVAAPAAGDDHVAPASVEVRYSYPETPFSASVEPPAVIAIEATLCHVSAPPATVGVVGAVRSMRTV